ncbi:tyrosine-type recombinase/integrase [Candidatus Poriferisodalis sp.]|uniref:tyrosine-type recombinase/integrase n=1 Tax=Candidatus Poriferisodalis sp. TaxID=3101277 RepID=UPI003B0137BF
MTTPRGRASGTGLAGAHPSAPPNKVTQINEANGSREGSDLPGLSGLEDATARRSPQRSDCWQEVVRGTIVTDEPALPDPLLQCPAYNEVSDLASLTESDAENLNGLFRHEVTHNTIRSYRSQWRRFAAWATTRGARALPAKPEHVAAYLAERFGQLGHKPATLRVAAAAIAYVHSNYGLENPCSHPDVRRTLRGATRMAGKAQKQAKGLTAEALDAIAATACQPRLGKNGRSESAQAAARRGSVDIALVRLMRDAMLRVSECAALTWSDIETVSDGSGRLLIRRSKTDPDGEGAVVFVSPQTMAALASIRNGAPTEFRVFELSPNQISLRIKKAALAAGLGDGFSGHSPRVGMAQDLARIGVELPSLMTAGRWRSPTMPAHYTRNETADRGAVAQFYRHSRDPRQPPLAT